MESDSAFARMRQSRLAAWQDGKRRLGGARPFSEIVLHNPATPATNELVPKAPESFFGRNATHASSEFQSFALTNPGERLAQFMAQQLVEQQTSLNPSVEEL